MTEPTNRDDTSSEAQDTAASSELREAHDAIQLLPVMESVGDDGERLISRAAVLDELRQRMIDSALDRAVLAQPTPEPSLRDEGVRLDELVDATRRFRERFDRE